MSTRLHLRGVHRLILAVLCGATGQLPAFEIVVDNRDGGFSVLSGQWRTGRVGKPYGPDYLWIPTVDGNPTAVAEWRTELPVAGLYEVAAWYVSDPHRATNALFIIEYPGGPQAVEVNQRIMGSRWVVLGTFQVPGKSEVSVRVNNSASRRSVVADAIRWRLLEPHGRPPETAAESSSPAGPSREPSPPDAAMADGTGTTPVPPITGELAPSPATQAAAEPATPGEFRGLWVTRFEWAHPDPARARAYIDRVMSQMARHRFNAVLFQVRGQADTLYPSPEEPWSPLISPTGADPGWDPLDYAIRQARRHGLEFHAYLNTHVAWQDPNHAPPRAPGHLFYRHCNANDPAARDWLIHNEDGVPVQFAADDYVWLAPGVPEVQAYIRRQVMHVVERYDVDGIHLDRIRTPGPQFSHDPVSRRRQATGSEGNPAGLEFGDWTRDQFTRLLTDLYAQIAEVKPHVKLSATPVGLYRQNRYPSYPATFHYGYSKCYQDAQAWLAAGALDFIVPQIYWADGGDPPDFTDLWTDWRAHAAGRHVYAGQSGNLPGPELLRQIRQVRRSPDLGQVGFHYGSYESRRLLDLHSRPDGPYAEPAPLPAMPWKTAPVTGIIIGRVAQAADPTHPVVDAWITREGSPEVALSSGDGLFAMLNVPPGTYRLTVRKTGYRTSTRGPITVTAGKVVRVDVELPPPDSPAPSVPGGSVTAEASPVVPPPGQTTDQPATSPGPAPPPATAPSEDAVTEVLTPSTTAAAPPAPADTMPHQPTTDSAAPPAEPVDNSKLIAWTLFILLMGAVAAAVAVAVFRTWTRRQ